MSEQSRPPRILIVGGGLAGPLMALALKKHNIASTVFELREKDWPHAGGSITLAPNASRALDTVGVYNKLRTQGYNYEYIKMLSARNLSTIGHLRHGSVEKYGYLALRIKRSVVRQVLLEEMARQGIEIRYGLKCTKVTESDSEHAVTLEFQNGQVKSADIVIGADGIHSKMREYIDPSGKSKARFTGTIAVGGTIDRSVFKGRIKNEDFPFFVLGKTSTFTFMPTTHDGSSISWLTITRESEQKSREEWEEIQADKESILAELKDRYCNDEWPEVVRDLCQAATVDSLMFRP